MSPSSIYTALTRKQREALERSITLLREQRDRYPAANVHLDEAIKAHQETLREGARLVENNYNA